MALLLSETLDDKGKHWDLKQRVTPIPPPATTRPFITEPAGGGVALNGSAVRGRSDQ